MEIDKNIDNEKFNIYPISLNDTHYLSIPKEHSNECGLYVSFYTLDDNLKRKLTDISTYVIDTFDNAITLLCYLDNNELSEFAEYNDNKVMLFKKLQKKIYVVLGYIYEHLKERDITLTVPVTIIKESDSDVKLANWLEIEDSKTIKTMTYAYLVSLYKSRSTDSTEGGGRSNASSNAKGDVKVKVLAPAKKGYVNFYIIITIMLSLIFGITIACLLIK